MKQRNNVGSKGYLFPLAREFAFIFTIAVPVGLSAQNPRTQVLLPILNTLDDAKVSGSLAFSGSCDPTGSPDFPKIYTTESIRDSVLQSVRDSFVDPAIQVTRESDGMIRMTQIGVPTDLLNVRINHLSFGEDGIYYPNMAVRVAMSAPEVVSFMKAHQIEWPFQVEVLTGNLYPPRDLPHISGSLDNVTISEMLDHILKTFPGIWTYEDCPRRGSKKRVVYIRLYQLRRIGSTAPFVE
jgi:hypothetical protein